MNLETKFEVGNVVFFLTKKQRVPCWACFGTGTIHAMRCITRKEAENPEFRYAKAMFMLYPARSNITVRADHVCPHCNGKGTVKAEYPIFEIRRGTVASIVLESNGDNTTLVYTVMSDDNTIYNLSDDGIYTTLDEAQKACDFMNLPRLNIDADRIKITSAFAKTIPCNEKLNKRLAEFKKNGKCDTEIFINSDGFLLDGYTSYLTYRMFGWKQMPVVVIPKDQESNFKIIPNISKTQMKKLRNFKFPVLKETVEVIHNGN